MTQSCTEIETLIDKRARGLDEAERLVLEQHLTECDGCRQSAGFMRAISQMVDDAPAQLSELARKRAISGAFTNVVRETEQVRRTRFVGPTAFAVAAAAALALLVPTAPKEAAQQTPTVQMAAHDTGASATRSSPPQAAPAAIIPSAPHMDWVEANEAQTRTFAHAEVKLEAGARVRFDEVHTTLELSHGRALIDVDVSKGRPFRVLTQRFRVEVLGTRFTVSPEMVEVERGRVQVFDLQGQPLARDLRPGSAFSMVPKPRAQTVEPHVGARVWLARAREALSQGDARAAREFVVRAEDSEPQRVDRAEAGTLRAECALIEHNPEAAVRLYRSVADRFADLSAGENAAFAAAQIASRSRSRELARPLFERYLTRYPKGRFADEARARVRLSK